jgi:hypothetical protein
VGSLRFLIERLDEPTFLAQLIEIFRASAEGILGRGFSRGGIHWELIATHGD